MDTYEGIKIAVEIIIALLGFLALTIFKRIQEDIKALTTSVQELNIKMAVVMNTQDNLDERVERLEGRP